MAIVPRIGPGARTAKAQRQVTACSIIGIKLMDAVVIRNPTRLRKLPEAKRIAQGRG